VGLAQVGLQLGLGQVFQILLGWVGSDVKFNNFSANTSQIHSTVLLYTNISVTVSDIY